MYLTPPLRLEGAGGVDHYRKLITSVRKNLLNLRLILKDLETYMIDGCCWVQSYMLTLFGVSTVILAFSSEQFANDVEQVADGLFVGNGNLQRGLPGLSVCLYQ